jgi:diacylglycerol kinase family enzyme
MAATSSSSNVTKLPPHLHSDRDIYVILSTKSGAGNAETYYKDTLQPILTHHDIAHVVRTTTSVSSIIHLVTSHIIPGATKGVKQTLILLSGDGGVVDIVNTIATTLMRDTYDNRIGSIFVKPVIALFPLGTANALAWSSGVAKDPIKTLLEGRARVLPIFEATFSPDSMLVTDEGRGREDIGLNYDGDAATIYGAVVFSWGLHASLVALSDTAEMRKHGVERFKMAAQQLLTDLHIYKGTVKVRRDRGGKMDDLIYPSSASADGHVYVLSTLMSNLEQHFRISPETTPLSNTLRLLALTPPSSSAASGDDGSANTAAADLTRVLTLAYKNGQHISEASVLYEPIDGLRIDFAEDDEKWRQICVDGKIIEVARGGWAAIRMLPVGGMDGRRVVELVVPE